MKRETIVEAPSVEEAIDTALEELGVQQDVVDYEVLEEPGRKMFGLGGERVAKVRVWLKDSFAAEIDEAHKVARDIVDPDGEAHADEDDEEGSELEAEDQESGRLDGPEYAQLTEEELDKVADAGIAAIEVILKHLGIEASVDEYEGDDGEIILDLVGPDLGILIGRHGKTLDALQVLVAAMARKQLEAYYPILVDVEGYRSRRKERLEGIARSSADKAHKHQKEVRLRPMTAYERKVVHIMLRDDKRVTTESEGEEPFRAVVIFPR